MSSSNFKKRFGSVERLYGKQQAALFPNIHICVVGLGGVGSWAIEALARTGIGQLTMIDYDTVCLSNVNRQIHALTETVDQKKSSALVERVSQINPDCQCHVIDDYLTIDNVRDYLSPEHHLPVQAQQDPGYHHGRGWWPHRPDKDSRQGPDPDLERPAGSQGPCQAAQRLRLLENTQALFRC